MTAGGNANLFVLQAIDGAYVTALDVQVGGSIVDASKVETDGRFVYVTIDTITARTVILRISGDTGNQVAVLGTGLGPNPTVLDCDGVGVIIRDNTVAERYRTHNLPVTFQRAGFADSNRAPFAKYALPIWE